VLASTFEFEWAQLPLRSGMWSIATYPGLRQREHAVIAFGEAGKVPMVRIHSECFTGDVVHSQRCDCGDQLEKSISLIQNHGHGFIIYLRDHEGRGIGLTEKIKAYQLQDAGMDTIDANLHLGHEIDARDWSDAIAIVKALGIKELTLLTNNPNKIQALGTAGVEVTQVNLTVAPNSFNEKYLATKEEKLGHLRGGK
jgi:3,4-dihydroxy 2-butanone 4-phosphate synthase/GTP cyclohydrolase II